jgi:hypothetical protein
MRRPVLLALIGGATAVIALIVVVVVLVIGVIDRNQALEDHDGAVQSLGAAVDSTQATAAEADDILALSADPLLAREPLAVVETAHDSAMAELDGAAALLADGVERRTTDEIRDLNARLDQTTAEVRDDDDRLGAALHDLVRATGDGAAAVEAANFSAENPPHLAFRSAVADLDTPADDEVAAVLTAYLDAAHALEASHAEAIAEKSGPLLDRRLEVEAFARSIAGGALLDFDWAVTVNGYGTDGSYGGTSYWQSADGGYATITLSDSVATMWPGAGVQSLVAHEVGHAILSTCTDLYFGSEYDQGNEEAWATAWAIGMGYTADGNGESIYGRPADGLIQLSTQCR